MRVLRNIAIIAVVSVIGVGVLQGVVLNGSATAQDTGNNSLIQDEMVVGVSSLEVTVNATGTIAPARQVSLAFELSTLPVKEIYVREGQPVTESMVLARLDADDLEVKLRNAALHLELQQLAYQALVEPPREVDIAVARAALNAARAQVNSVFASAPDEVDAELARIQTELARNRLWQQQLQRDLAVDPPVPPGVPEHLVQGISEEEQRQF